MPRSGRREHPKSKLPKKSKKNKKVKEVVIELNCIEEKPPREINIGEKETQLEAVAEQVKENPVELTRNM